MLTEKQIEVMRYKLAERVLEMEGDSGPSAQSDHYRTVVATLDWVLGDGDPPDE